MRLPPTPSDSLEHLQRGFAAWQALDRALGDLREIVDERDDASARVYWLASLQVSAGVEHPFVSRDSHLAGWLVQLARQVLDAVDAGLLDDERAAATELAETVLDRLEG